VWTRGIPYLLLAVLDLLFFAPLALRPSDLLYSDHSDLLAMHLPTKQFLVRSWHQTGELPLWCPYSFGGMPLIHDVQVAVFYPLHFPLYVLHEDQIGAALSWLVVLHVLIAGWGMYAYARFWGLNGWGSLVAALGYMFAGKWLMHILSSGHYILTPLAWLPLVLLALEQSLRRRSVLWACVAGMIFALIIVGTHPQLTLYSGIFVALWTLGTARRRQGDKETRRQGDKESKPTDSVSLSPCLLVSLSGAARWLAQGSVAALVAMALSAVQLLPALEAAGQSSRSVGVSVDELLEESSPTLRSFLEPSLVGMSAERRAGLGLLWTAFTLMAPLLCWKRARFPFLVWLLLVLFALGGAVLLQGLPGFRLFVLPQRMLLLAALPAALLVGITVQTLIDIPGPAPNQRFFCCLLLLLLVLSAFLLSASTFGTWWENWRRGESAAVLLYWAILPFTTAAALWLLVRRPSWPPLVRATVWTVVLFADLWALTWPLVAVRSESEVYTPSGSVRYLEEHRTYQINGRTYPGRVLSFGWSEQPAMTPLGAALPLRLQIEPVLGYNSFDIYRYKDYLQFIMDADVPLRPREGRFGFPIVAEFPLTNQALVNLLGVQYLQQPINHPPLAGWREVPEARDPNPKAFVFYPGGIRDLGPFSLYRNENVLPRAFVVPHAEPLPQRSKVLETLKRTDFKRTVLLEDFAPETPRIEKGTYQPVTIRNYRPNRVDIELDGKTSGYLVLAEVWFPGWTCTIDGREVPVQRANFLFRAVPIAVGDRHVIFTFAPSSYRWGKVMSALALAGALALALLAGVRRWQARRRA
jgi:hypothetical protein